MPPLARVFAFKIAVTLLAWSLPLLMLPATRLQALGVAQPEDVMFLRLLGWAWLALCIGYGFGLRDARAGRAAAGPVWVGIASNGGAAAWLLGYGLAGAWSGWPAWLQAAAWASTVAAAGLALALWRYGVRAAPRVRPPAGRAPD
jgi:hypothetical protein